MEGGFRQVELVGEEFHCVRYPGILGAGEIAPVVPIVFHSRSDVVPSTGMFCPRAPFSSSVMDSYLTSWWCHWCLIIIKAPMNEGIG